MVMVQKVFGGLMAGYRREREREGEREREREREREKERCIVLQK